MTNELPKWSTLDRRQKIHESFMKPLQRAKTPAEFEKAERDLARIETILLMTQATDAPEVSEEIGFEKQ